MTDFCSFGLLPVFGAVAPAASGSGSGSQTGGAGMFILLGIFLVYFLPSFLAFRKKHPQRWLIAGVNAFLGWTIIGYVIALYWYRKGPHTEAPATIQLRPAGTPPPLPLEFLPPQPPVSIIPAPAAPSVAATGAIAASSSGDEIEQLTKLCALFEKGFLTQEEFNLAKTRILSP